ncbi:hypothetical protein GCM10007968_15280 [Sporolactobacillus putidus]|uniref:Uncharacterized protein n=1 Tax=Sporolactobacillus putidus TaxID=492735 RepID=A0A917S335_9BACL|nr:hypothetical protein GCM10007968_15280 [Sporolactobacillus putidus]
MGRCSKIIKGGNFVEINNDSIVLPLPTDTLLEKEEKMWRVALPKSY